MASVNAPRSATDRAGRLLRDCHAHEASIPRGTERVKVVYLYYMQADADLDGVLLRHFKSGRTDVMPPYLIGTVAKVPELHRHILNLRTFPAYKDAVIAIRIWNPSDTEPIRWDTPLELEEDCGPIAILADPPKIVNRTKVYALEAHPGSRIGGQYFVDTRNETSPNVFISNVAFFETKIERAIMASAALLSIALPVIAGAQGAHLIATAFDQHPAGSATAVSGGLAGLLLGVQYGRPRAKRTMRAHLHPSRGRSTASNRVFMRQEMFQRMRVHEASFLDEAAGQAQGMEQGSSARQDEDGEAAKEET